MSSHNKNTEQLINMVANILQKHGMEESVAIDRARNLATPLLYGETITPFMIAEMLIQKKNADGTIAVEGFDSIHVRGDASNEIYLLWSDIRDTQNQAAEAPTTNRKTRIKRAINMIIAKLQKYGMDKNDAIHRTKNMATAATCGTPFTPTLAAEMLTPIKNPDGSILSQGFNDIATRSKASIDISRIWLVETAANHKEAWVALWTHGGITKSAAINCLKKMKGLSQEEIDSINQLPSITPHAFNYTSMENTLKQLDGVLANIKKFGAART